MPITKLLRAVCPRCSERIAIKIEVDLDDRTHRLEKLWVHIDPLLGKIPDSAIAAKFGCSGQSVTSRRRALGIEKCSYSDIRLKRRREKIFKLWKGGRSLTDIAQAFGVTKERIRQIVGTESLNLTDKEESRDQGHLRRNR